MDNNILSCGICHSEFKNPQILPGCGHTFCLACVEQIPKTTVGIFHGASATADKTCPVCRKRFHSWLVKPNFALQHVIAEPCLSDNAVYDESRGYIDLSRGSSNTDISQIYQGLGVPPQLAQLLAEEDHCIAFKVYILDNSGSMAAGDGQIIYPQEKSYHNQIRRATRWDELKHMALQHAQWNAKLGVPSEFVLLNSANPTNPVDGKDFVRIDAQRGSAQQQISALKQLLDRSYPMSTTPLTERLHDLRCRLHKSSPELQQKDRKLMLVLVTDGVANGTRGAFTEAIRRLGRELPVHIVVRLCTSDDSVSEFYNQVDKEVELSLDILDDFQTEARNIYYYNPWLTYPQVLHIVREAGTLSKLLDFVDERCLTPMEVGLCAQILLRPQGKTKYPWQPEQLLEAVERDLSLAPSVFDIRRRAVAPILDVQAFRAALLPAKHSITGQVANALGLGGVAESWYDGRNLWDALRNPKMAAAGPPKCALCTRTKDGTYPHCCRTCQRSGGKEHGPTCERRQHQVPVDPAGGHPILKLGTVPAGTCFLCARATDGIFPHCCRTCERSGGTCHGPTCESRHASLGYPSACVRADGQAMGKGKREMEDSDVRVTAMFANQARNMGYIESF